MFVFPIDEYLAHLCLKKTYSMVSLAYYSFCPVFVHSIHCSYAYFVWNVFEILFFLCLFIVVFIAFIHFFNIVFSLVIWEFHPIHPYHTHFSILPGTFTNYCALLPAPYPPKKKKNSVCVVCVVTGAWSVSQ